MQSWDINALDSAPHTPNILSSSDDARVIVLDLPASERLREHEVHERAFVLVVSGELEVIPETGATVTGGPGLLVEFEPQERHEVLARADARILLVLTPWPGSGHPGTLTLDEKADVRGRAAERNDAA